MIKIILQGFLIGAAKVIPGFSGSLLAITFGVYEKTLEIIADFKKITVAKLFYLLLLGSGIVMGIVLFSYVVRLLLKSTYFWTMLLFIGLIIGSMKDLVFKIKGYHHYGRGFVYFTLSAIIVFIFSFKKASYTLTNLSSVAFFPLGIVEAFTTLIPGISGTAVYMILGVYDLILNLYINIVNISNLPNLLLFGLGFVIGTIILAKLLDFILKRYSKILFRIILGFMFSSVCILIRDAFTVDFNIFDTIVGLLFLVLGYIISNKLNHLF